MLFLMLSKASFITIIINSPRIFHYALVMTLESCHKDKLAYYLHTLWWWNAGVKTISLAISIEGNIIHTQAQQHSTVIPLRTFYWNNKINLMSEKKLVFVATYCTSKWFIALGTWIKLSHRLATGLTALFKSLHNVELAYYSMHRQNFYKLHFLEKSPGVTNRHLLLKNKL